MKSLRFVALIKTINYCHLHYKMSTNAQQTMEVAITSVSINQAPLNVNANLGIQWTVIFVKVLIILLKQFSSIAILLTVRGLL